MKIGKTAFGAFVLILALASHTASAQAPAPVTFQGNTYQVFIAPGISWVDARALADAKVFGGTSGHLANITSAEEDVFIDSRRREAIAQFGPVAAEFWIGGIQIPCTPEPTCGWEWENGEAAIPGVNPTGPLDDYANWLTGEPNDLGTESHIGVGLGNQFGWNDEGFLGNIGGYIVEYDGVVDAVTCEFGGDGCNPTGAMNVKLPEGVQLEEGDTLTQVLVENPDFPGQVSFVDPRVDINGNCTLKADGSGIPADPREILDVFGNETLILPEFLCGSPNFAVIRSDAAGFAVLGGVVRSEQFPENVFQQFYECRDPYGLRDLQERGVFVWQPDENEDPVLEGRALELTNDCGSSRGATRELSYFVLNLHIDCGIPFGSNDPGVLQCFVDLTNDKFANLGIALENARTSLTAPNYGMLRSLWSSAADNFLIGNYSKALARLERFIARVESAEFDVGSLFHHQGNVLMRAENIRFMITDKIDPAP
jgi:hypothetical protein